MNNARPHFASPEDVHRNLPFGRLIEDLASAFAEGCVAPHRHQHVANLRGEAESTLLLMPSWTRKDAPEPYIALKVMTVIPGEVEGLPKLDSKVFLIDGSSGQMLLIADGNAVTARRTVATAALAARFLARPASRRLLVLGSGRVGALLYDAYREVFPLERVDVWDVNGEMAQTLVRTLKDRGVDARLVDDLPAAIRSADIIASATRSNAALFFGRDLQPGTHVDLIGSFKPGMREADDEAIARSSVFIDTDNALVESGDLIQPMEAGAISSDHIKGSLLDLCSGCVTGRRSDDEITLFKTVGSAIADLAAVRSIYRSLSA